jgi:hypothetical protein
MRIKLAGDWGAADGRDQGGKIRRHRRTAQQHLLLTFF